MPTYEITAPDGKVLEITAPDGATQEQVLAYARAQYKPTAQPQPERVNPTDGMSTLDRVRAGVGKSLVDTGRGLKQLATNNVKRHSSAVTALVDRFGIDPAKRIAHGIDDALSGAQRDQQAVIDESRRTDAPLMDTGGGLAGNIGGSVAQSFLLPGVGASSLAGRLGVSAAQGGAFAGSQPVASGESRGGNMALGAGLGAVGQSVASGLGRLGKGMSDKISEPMLALYERAQQAGIPVHFSQLSDSKFAKTLASAVGYLPFSGSGAKAAAQQEAFNRAASRGFGEDAAVIGDDVLAQARQRIGGDFQDIYSRNGVALDDEALNRLAEIQLSAGRSLPPNEAQVVGNQIEDILAMAQGGQMPGLAYQAFRTDRLLPMEAGVRSFQSNAIRDIRKALDEAANRSLGGDDAKALAKARGQYSNLKTVEKALKQVAGSQGNVRPASLWPIVQQAGPKATKEMKELARVGQMLKDPIPDSGTAARMLVYGALGAGGTADLQDGQLSDVGKLLLLGMTAGRAVNSKAAAKYMARGSKPLEGLARLVKPVPRALPAAGLSVAVGGGRVATPEEIAADEEIVRRFREGR